MRMLHFILLGLSAFVEDVAEPDVDVAIVFAVDASASVNTTEAKLQRDGHAAAIIDPRVLSAIASGPRGCIAISYFEWSGSGQTRLVLPWTKVCAAEDAHAASSAIRRLGNDGSRCHRRCDTSISGAIEFASALLDRHEGTATRKVIDISANGTNNDGAPLELSRSRALGSGRTINAIVLPAYRYGIPHSMREYFTSHVIGGPGAFVMEPGELGDYADALERKLIREISAIQRARECEGTPDEFL